MGRESKKLRKADLVATNQIPDKAMDGVDIGRVCTIPCLWVGPCGEDSLDGEPRREFDSFSAPLWAGEINTGERLCRRWR